MNQSWRLLIAWVALGTATTVALWMGFDTRSEIRTINKTIVKREEIGKLRGPRGERGEKGERGKPGVSRRVVVIRRIIVPSAGPPRTVTRVINRPAPAPPAPVRLPPKPKRLVPLETVPPRQGGVPPGLTKPGKKCPPRNPHC